MSGKQGPECFFEWWSGGSAQERLSTTISTLSILSITFPHILNPLSHRYRRENCCHKRRDVPFLIMMLCVGPLNFTSFTPSHTSVRAFKRQCSNLTNLCGGTRERRKEWRERPGEAGARFLLIESRARCKPTYISLLCPPGKSGVTSGNCWHYS